MRTKRSSGRTEIERLIFFSDAVMAIAITLLVLGLEIPQGLAEADLVHAIGSLGHEFVSIVLSFFVIGRFWISHHQVFQHVGYYDSRLLVLNGLFLLSIVLVPFPTAVLGAYPTFRAALILYAASIISAGLLFALLWVYVVYIGQLVPDDFDSRISIPMLVRFLVVPGVFLASIPVAVATNHLPSVLAMWVVLPPIVRYVIRRYQSGARRTNRTDATSNRG